MSENYQLYIYTFFIFIPVSYQISLLTRQFFGHIFHLLQILLLRRSNVHLSHLNRQN